MKKRTNSWIYILVLVFLGFSIVMTGSATAQSSGFVDIDPTDLPGDGTIENPYRITNISEFQSIKDNPRVHYALGNNIDARATANWNGGSGFKQIGVMFGSLDGNNYTINGLTINRPNTDGVGIIDGNAAGIIKDIAFKNTTIRGARDTAGLVVGNTASGEIQNVNVAGNITGVDSVGGLVVSNDGTIRNSTVTVNISGVNSVGGHAALNEGTIQNSTTQGQVIGSDTVGGLVGENLGKIRDTTVRGTIDGSQTVGGLVGVSSGTIQDSTVVGEVNGSDSVGGLTGRSTGRIENVTTSGTVTGFNDVGGLVGKNEGPVQNASSKSSVIGSKRGSSTLDGSYSVGGLIGVNRDTIRDVKSTGSVSGVNHVGGLVGTNSLESIPGAEIIKAASTGDVKGEYAVGGLVGKNENLIKIASASGSVTGSNHVGGFVGDNEGLGDLDGSIVNTKSTGDVSGSQTVGGFAGSNTGQISTAFAVGPVSGTSEVGGFVGGQSFDEGGTQDSYWDTQTSTQSTTAGGAEGLTTSQMTGSAAVTNMQGFEFDHVWTTQPDGYPTLKKLEGNGSDSGTDYVDVDPSDLAGEGTEADPYVITNASELQAMEDDLDAHYELSSDIDASNTELWNTGNGFDPVGQNYNTPFQGTINAAGYTINNLTVNRSDDDRVGLIGVNDDQGEITNITIANVKVTGDLYTGGIVGSNDGKIVSSSVTGAVTGSNNVGGLAGSNGGYLNESDANVSVDGEAQVGGLVGANFANTVYKSHATGPVDGASRVGGLVGSNYRTVVSSYATGSVTGNSKIGGLVGYNQRYGDKTTIVSTYSVGNVTGTNTVGGLVGYNNATVRASYWDIESTGQSASQGGTGLRTTQMTGQAAQTNMSGLVFGTVWDVQSGGYPILAQQADDKSDQSGSVQVQLSNVSLTPQSVDSDSESTHQLSFEAQNVSADGNEDEFDITFPDRVELISYSDVAIDEKSSGVEKVANTLEFSVNPSGGGSTQIAGELNVTVSATN